MPLIQKPALRALYDQLTRDALANPSVRVDNAVLDQIVSIVGDKKRRSASDVRATLQNGTLSPDQKIALARGGLDKKEKADLEAILADPAFLKLLDLPSANFLRAIVGLPAVSTLDAAPAAAPTSTATGAAPTAAFQAAQKMRDLVKSGELSRWYNAAVGAVDNPQLKAEAEALFAALPVVKPGMSADEFVKAGLWTQAPKGVAEMQKSARYLPGRQILVETNVHAQVPSRSDPSYETERRKVGAYDKNGPRAVTYRATLVGEDPKNKSNFLVKVDGADQPISVTKASVFAHNQPHELARQYVHSDTKRDLPYNWERWKIDYASPLAKAKLCEIAILMDDIVKKIDFSKMKTDDAGGARSIFGGSGAGEMVKLQEQCVEKIFRSIDMRYPRDDGKPFSDPGRAPAGNSDVARQAIKGTGMCVQQSSVFGALLMPFMDVLGIDGQYRSGNCFRNIRGATPNVFAPDHRSGHGWWQLTFRPSMKMTVTDRTWDQVNLPLDRAYGFPYGDRYASQNIVGYQAKPVGPTDVNVSGDVTVETVDRQFSRAGDGRENHISLRDGR